MGEDLIAARRACANAQDAALLPVDVGKNILEVVFSAPDVLRESENEFARAREAQSGLSVKKRRIIIALQPLDMVGKRLLRNVQPVGCLCHIKVFGQF